MLFDHLPEQRKPEPAELPRFRTVEMMQTERRRLAMLIAGELTDWSSIPPAANDD